MPPRDLIHPEYIWFDVGVYEIDGVMIGNGRVGKITDHLQQLYDDTVHGRNQYAAAWLDQMVLEPII